MVPGLRTLALPAVLAVALVAGPLTSVRAGGEGTKIKPVQEQLRQLDSSLKKAFEKVGDEIKALQRDLQGAKEERADSQQKLLDAVTRITVLDRAVSEMKRDLEALKKPVPRVEAAAASEPDTLAEIRARLARIEKMLDRPLVPSRAAFYPPAAEASDGRREKLRDVREELRELDASARRGFGRLGEDLTALRREVKDCREDRTLAQLRFQTALARLGTLQPELAEVRDKLEALRARPPATVSLYPAGERLALDDIRAQLRDIERTLQRTPAPSTVSFYPTGRTGRVALVNTYPEELTFVVDGRSYAVAPGGTMTVDGQPAGTLTYEIVSPTWGVRDRRTTTLGPNETLTLTAR